MATAWSGSTPQVSGWATDPSTLLFQILAKVEDGSSPKSSQNTRPVSTLNMHSASIASYCKQSNNHATRHTLEIKSTTWQVSTLGRSMQQHKGSMASQAKHGISKQLGITSVESKPGGVGSYTGDHTTSLPVTSRRMYQLVPNLITTPVNTNRLPSL